jgi:hypothetical protein
MAPTTHIATAAVARDVLMEKASRANAQIHAATLRTMREGKRCASQLIERVLRVPPAKYEK